MYRRYSVYQLVEYCKSCSYKTHIWKESRACVCVCMSVCMISCTYDILSQVLAYSQYSLLLFWPSLSNVAFRTVRISYYSLSWYLILCTCRYLKYLQLFPAVLNSVKPREALWRVVNLGVRIYLERAKMFYLIPTFYLRAIGTARFCLRLSLFLVPKFPDTYL